MSSDHVMTRVSGQKSVRKKNEKVGGEDGLFIFEEQKVNIQHTFSSSH